MKPIIRIQGLGKRYKLGQRASYGNLRESITNTLTSPARVLRSLAGRARTNGKGQDDGHIWALRDVNLDIMPGEVVGVIGRNGAGKSTLLKILSRITEPTTGRVDLYGRVGSLLEVGTGFHPELTGRENIYLSAAILGMRRAEIERKFDEIVAFAEVEKFIDTPVKHYSSGMYVRLAFAVAAHLEPEILVVDEVLAVGDAAFQKKCLGKMGDVARGGRTVLFVSHNMASIQSLCHSCLLLSGGRIGLKAAPLEVIGSYLRYDTGSHQAFRSFEEATGRLRSAAVMSSAELLSDEGARVTSLTMGTSLTVRARFVSLKAIRPALTVAVRAESGWPLFVVSNRLTSDGERTAPIMTGMIDCEITQPALLPGRYLLDLHFGDLGDVTQDSHVVLEAFTFEVTPVDIFGTGKLPWPHNGPIFCQGKWTVRADDGFEQTPKLTSP